MERGPGRKARQKRCKHRREGEFEGWVLHRLPSAREIIEISVGWGRERWARWAGSSSGWGGGSSPQAPWSLYPAQHCETFMYSQAFPCQGSEKEFERSSLCFFLDLFALPVGLINPVVKEKKVTELVTRDLLFYTTPLCKSLYLQSKI